MPSNPEAGPPRPEKANSSSGAPASAEALGSISWIALMAALMAAGAYMHVTLAYVPVTFQDFFIILAGLMLGPRRGMLAVILYILAGGIGLPVFSGGRAGFAHLLGPTGGYLLGFVFTAGASGLGARFAYRRTGGGTPGFKEGLIAFCGALVGLLLVYAFGMAGLVWLVKLTPAQAFTVGVLPFLPVGPFKALAAVMVWRRLRRRSLGPKGAPV